MEKESICVTLIDHDENYEVEFNLHSHYTVIIGLDSGEGKSLLFSRIEEGFIDSSFEVKLSNPEMRFVLADPANIEAVLDSEVQQIVMIDESVVLKPEILKRMNNSKHLFICITRSFTFCVECGMNGIYTLQLIGKKFEIEPAPSLRTTDLSNSKAFDKVVVEAAPDRSEGQLLNHYGVPTIAACGRDRIIKKIQNDRTLVFADLGGIGRAYKVLYSKCLKNNNLYFYDYQSFEEIIYNSRLIQSIPVASDSQVSVFDVLTIEKYFEQVLFLRTKNTAFEYRHRFSVLSDEYFKQPLTDLVPKGLAEFIQSYQKDKDTCKLNELNVF